MNWETVEAEDWYSALNHDIRDLLAEVGYLLERERQLVQSKEIVDYSFLVFPAAKAFEGFLKVYFFEMGMMGEEEFYNDHFRIGKALNPDLPTKYRDDGWVYDDVTKLCGMEAADFLWQVWKECRNQVFHYSEKTERRLKFEDAEKKIEMIIEAMGKAMQCQYNLSKNKGDTISIPRYDSLQL